MSSPSYCCPLATRKTPSEPALDSARPLDSEQGRITRALIVGSLLDAGADPRIKDKEGQIAQDYVDENDTETLKAFRRYLAQESISKGDIAEDDDDDDDDEDFDDSGLDDEE